MNRWFGFSHRQLLCILALCITACGMNLYLFVASRAESAPPSPRLELILGQDDKIFTGVFILDPNTSPADSLELLPGIGRTLADRIVEYRKTHSFKREVDITDINGIGPKLYERIKPYLRIARP
ncbi:MAG: helix-hairpin-helix domain-containing protein [Candidatus Zixiibacteriota bacterium]